MTHTCEGCEQPVGPVYRYRATFCDETNGLVAYCADCHATVSGWIAAGEPDGVIAIAEEPESD